MKTLMLRPTAIAFGLTIYVLAGLGYTYAENANFSTKNNANNPVVSSHHASSNKEANVYIIEFRDDPIMDYKGGIDGLEATRSAAKGALSMTSSAVDRYRTFLTRKQDAALTSSGIALANKIHSYTLSFNGIAANLTPSQANLIRGDPDVISVRKDKVKKDT